MPSGTPLLSAYVDILANHGDIDSYLNSLPGLVGNSMGQAAAKAKVLRDEIERQEAALKSLVASMGGAAQGNQFAAAMAQSLNRLKGELTSTARQMDALKRSSPSGKGAYRLMQFGQLADDLQYVSEQGLRPIIGNLMQLNPVLGLMAIGVDQAVKHWGFLKGAFGDDTWIGTAIRKIDQMTAGLRGQAEETSRLAKVEKERADALASVGGVKAEGDADRGAGVTKALEQVGGGDKAIDILQKKMTDAGLKLDEKNIGQVRGDLARVIAKAQQGDQGAVDELNRRASGTKLGDRLAATDPTNVAVKKSLAEKAKAEAADAERADPEAERLAADMKAKGKEAAAGFGDGLHLDLLRANALDDVEGRAKVAESVRGRLEAAGTSKEDAPAVAREAVNAAVDELNAAVRARFLGGESGSIGEARADEARKIQDDMDEKRKSQLPKEEKAKDRNSETIGIDEYLSRLQSGAFGGGDPALDESKKQTEELRKLNDNVKDMGGPAKFAGNR